MKKPLIMLRIAHFFKGKLGKEEIASAFLAMALEGVPRFRKYFLKLVTNKEYLSLHKRKWDVSVEVRHVDVRMDAGETVVLIENKVNAGAKQRNQLFRYYKAERRHNPDARVIMVYISPGSIGKDEIKLVADSPEFKARPNDLVKHISWESLSDYIPEANDIPDKIVTDFLKETSRIIAEARVQKYICEGDRETIRSIVKRSLDSIMENTGVSLAHWPGRENEQIFTNNTNVTMWLDTAFKSSDEPPHAPINLYNEHGLMQISIRSQFKLEGKVKKSSNLGRWWTQQTKCGFIEIPGVGAHKFQENGWFFLKKDISGNEKVIEKAIIDTGTAVLKTLSRKLTAAGFSLLKNE